MTSTSRKAAHEIKMLYNRVQAEGFFTRKSDPKMVEGERRYWLQGDKSSKKVMKDRGW